MKKLKNKFHLWIAKKVFNLLNKIYLLELQQSILGSLGGLDLTKSVRYTIYVGGVKFAFSANTPKDQTEMGRTLEEFGKMIQAPRRLMTKNDLTGL